MIPVEFTEQTDVFAKDQPEYQPLPAHVVPNNPQGAVHFCWKLTPEEALYVAQTGCIWQTVWTFNHPLQPQMLQVVKPEMGKPD